MSWPVLAKAVMGDDAQLEAEVLIWSSVHGLASLLLDGPLAGEFSSMEERLDFARRVVGLARIPFTGTVPIAKEES